MRRTLITAAVAAAILVITSVFAPTVVASPEPGEIWATDAGGSVKNTYLPGDPVYVKGVGLLKGRSYMIYIIPDKGTQIGPGDVIPIGDAVVTAHVTTDPQNGALAPTLVWANALPGFYDVFADCQDEGTQGVYEPHIDAKDEEGVLIPPTAGFFVIPENPLGTIAVLSAGFTALYIKRRKIL